MKSDLVRKWFGKDFDKLDPLLQKLHILGGELSGSVDISYGKGLSGFIGKRLAHKIQLPKKGHHKIVVVIFFSKNGLHWKRQFNNNNIVESLFTSVANNKTRFWIEKTGPLTMQLTVDIINGAWVWRCLNISLFGITIPLWLIPRLHSSKKIVNGQYKFQVAFSYPLLGNLVSYKGVLETKFNDL
ncbi:MAG: DUF4166 domain-containing protein [Saccharospirillaceae bacterium]|nr:DUF4166 domain-containing protein [Pseudomonadales bacterium]NRB77546.1 DUF4166 domain-containing protein [Saccharospirillaceae bacterium]